MKKYIIYIVILLITCAGCDNKYDEIIDEEIIIEKEQVVEKIEYINLDEYFGEIVGTAVFKSGDTTFVYNDELAQKQHSPYSTFKIISTLIGLEEGILTSKDTKMNYNGSIYWYELWNNDLNLKDAFRHSCVWYYHQLINKIPENTVQKYINNINYGNLDLSEWDGNGKNTKKDLNGFWLDSSLKISPLEQVSIIQKIFEDQTNFKNENIEILKELMITEKENIYAKTGGGSSESWYVGFVNENDEITYFAVFLTEKSAENINAKDIFISIFESEF